jgi:farnesyl diphosphate synthase
MQMLMTNDLNLTELSELCAKRLDNVFDHYLHNITAPELKSAMEYSLFNGGKRIRPLLIYATGCIFDAPLENLDIPASSVELIHTYSLIHDDLPCMDNADLRRGKPSSHKMYGEGMAVLTGDALHTLAMQIIASHPASLRADKRNHMMAVLSKACGPFGMAAGQALDITMMNDAAISLDLLTNIYHLKTGALFSSCIELGRLASADEDEINQRALSEFGQYIGLAFQIQDDILDIEAETATLGKIQGIDVINNKMTYPKLIGLDLAKDKVQSLYQRALESIDYLGSKAQLLRDLTSQMLGRRR